MISSNRHVVIPIFVPHKGCPFDCIFCNQRKISGQTEDISIDSIHSTIQEHLKTIKPNTIVEIAFFGGSFTGIDKDTQINYLSVANHYVLEGKVSQIRLSTRPDYINSEILDYLKLYNVGTIELGVQSLDDEVLLMSQRGHTAEDVYKASKLIKEYGFELGLQTMVGLPGDTRERDIYTANKIVDLKPAIVRIYPVLVIKGTCLEKMLLEGKYIPPNIEDAVDICADLLDLYEDNNIKVIRVGLQTNENISVNSEVVAGPMHPAFRQLAESRRELKKIEKMIADEGLESLDTLIIKTDEKNISNVIGQKKSNIEYLKKKYGFKSVKVTV